MGKGSSLGVGFVLYTVVVVVLATYGAKGVFGQQNPSCAAKLVPCAPYLNYTTKPPSSCCDPLKDAITNDLQCLCTLYADPNVFKAYGINITEARALPNLCGIPNSGFDACNNAPAPTAGGPSGTSGSNRVAWIGMSGLTGLLLLWASMMV